MSKVIWNPAAVLAPVPPALVSCGTVEKPNVLTVAWTGIINSTPAMTYVSIRPERYSYGLIRESGEFVINLTTAALVRAADLCGVKSGRDLDKFEACGLTAAPASKVSAPVIAESPLSLECRVKEVLPLGSHHMFLAEILAVDVEARYLDEKGKLHLQQSGLAAYAHGEYYALGKKIGSFGFSVKKKRPKNPGKR
ncbi:MAG: flavin reductase family protein [Oscillospiraceae bacterium]|nr:flavin reductase family protein [Oscillospiraceae bacterium]